MKRIHSFFLDYRYPIKDSRSNDPDEMQLFPFAPHEHDPRSTSTSHNGVFSGFCWPSRSEAATRGRSEVYRRAFHVTRMSRVRIVPDCFRFVRRRRRFAVHGTAIRAHRVDSLIKMNIYYDAFANATTIIRHHLDKSITLTS